MKGWKRIWSWLIQENVGGGGRGNTLVTAYTCPKTIVNYPYEGRVSSEFQSRELVILFNTAVHSSQKTKDKIFKVLNQNKKYQNKSE